MFHTPAHLQLDPAKQGAQIVNTDPIEGRVQFDEHGPYYESLYDDGERGGEDGCSPSYRRVSSLAQRHGVNLSNPDHLDAWLNGGRSIALSRD